MRLRVLLCVLLLAGCTASEPAPLVVDPGAIVVSRLQRGVVMLPDPTVRHPAGSQVVRVDANGTETVLSEGLAAAGAAAVHHDGTRVLFVGRRRADAHFSVFESEADGSEVRVVVDHGTDCVRADYLPDGRIVYAAALPSPSPLIGVARGAALFVAEGNGRPGSRITFGAGLDTDPSVLSDGRIVFSSWRPGTERLGLFTVHPDGTGVAPFHLPAAHAVLPSQQADGDVRFVALGDGDVTTLVADWDAPMSVASEARPVRGTALAARPRPQGHLSSMRPERLYGTLVCVDVRANGAGSAMRARLRSYDDGSDLGVVALEPDGSFMVRVPPDMPLVIELLDAGDAVVAAEHGPFWVRNNEVRVCATCHDDFETGPPNVRPLAVLREPVELMGGGQ